MYHHITMFNSRVVSKSNKVESGGLSHDGYTPLKLAAKNPLKIGLKIMPLKGKDQCPLWREQTRCF